MTYYNKSGTMDMNSQTFRVCSFYVLSKREEKVGRKVQPFFYYFFDWRTLIDFSSQLNMV